MIDLTLPSNTQDTWAILLQPDRPLFSGGTFTRSDGSIVARLYERLTKASRRDVARVTQLAWGDTQIQRIKERETAYRQGIYDAYKALQEELAE